MTDTQRRMLRWGIWIGGPLACLGAMSSVGAVLAADQAGRIAPGTQVAGVQLGDLDVQRAAARLEAALTPRLSEPVVLVAGTKRAEVTPDVLGARVPALRVARVAQLRSDQAAAPTQAVRALGMGPGVSVEVRLDVNRRRMDQAVKKATGQLTISGRSAELVFGATGRPRIRPAVDGSGPTPSAVRVAIREGALATGTARTVTLKARAVPADLTTEEAEAKYARLIVVDKSEQRITLYVNLRRVKTYRTSTAIVPYVTPEGEWPIANKQRNPTWNVPNSPWAGELAGQVIPPGPANPLRERWMGLADGIGFHGTSDVVNLGSPASHGCIRMSPADVIHLFDRVKVGTPVVVRA